MGNLVEKYRTLKLTKEELLQLRKEVNSSSDEEQGADMQKHWEEDIDVSDVSEVIIKTIQEHLNVRIQASTTFHKMLWRFVQRAAVVLLPICFIALGYMVYWQKKHSEDLLTICTNKGEQVSITFPDGTQVKVNELSTVSYSPHAFSKEHREISFSGEAYFEVHHNSEHPFLVHTPDMDVKVTGTKFNLSNYLGSSRGAVYLFDGSVSLLSTKTREQIMMEPNEECVLEKSTGHFTLKPFTEDASYYTAWKRHELVFHSVPLKKVIQELGVVYGVDIQIQNLNVEDCFTGTLPSSNFNKCMVIISDLYHCKVNRMDEAVILTK